MVEGDAVERLAVVLLHAVVFLCFVLRAMCVVCARQAQWGRQAGRDQLTRAANATNEGARAQQPTQNSRIGAGVAHGAAHLSVAAERCAAAQTRDGPARVRTNTTLGWSHISRNATHGLERRRDRAEGCRHASFLFWRGIQNADSSTVTNLSRSCVLLYYCCHCVAAVCLKGMRTRACVCVYSCCVLGVFSSKVGEAVDRRRSATPPEQPFFAQPGLCVTTHALPPTQLMCARAFSRARPLSRRR